MTVRSPQSKKDDHGRKPYETPRVEVYGDIRDIAKAIGHTGKTDGGAHGLKTQ